MTDLRAIAARLHAAYHLGDVQAEHPIRAAHDALIVAALERELHLIERAEMETERAALEAERDQAVATAAQWRRAVEVGMRYWVSRVARLEAERDALRNRVRRVEINLGATLDFCGEVCRERDALRAAAEKRETAAAADAARNAACAAQAARLRELREQALRGEEG